MNEGMGFGAKPRVSPSPDKLPITIGTIAIGIGSEEGLKFGLLN